jgi:hypothetical protein
MDYCSNQRLMAFARQAVRPTYLLYSCKCSAQRAGVLSIVLPRHEGISLSAKTPLQPPTIDATTSRSRKESPRHRSLAMVRHINHSQGLISRKFRSLQGHVSVACMSCTVVSTIHGERASANTSRKCKFGRGGLLSFRTQFWTASWGP